MLNYSELKSQKVLFSSELVIIRIHDYDILCVTLIMIRSMQTAQFFQFIKLKFQAVFKVLLVFHVMSMHGYDYKEWFLSYLVSS